MTSHTDDLAATIRAAAKLSTEDGECSQIDVSRVHAPLREIYMSSPHDAQQTAKSFSRCLELGSAGGTDWERLHAQRLDEIAIDAPPATGSHVRGMAPIQLNKFMHQIPWCSGPRGVDDWEFEDGAPQAHLDFEKFFADHVDKFVVTGGFLAKLVHAFATKSHEKIDMVQSVVPDVDVCVIGRHTMQEVEGLFRAFFWGSRPFQGTYMEPSIHHEGRVTDIVQKHYDVLESGRASEREYVKYTKIQINDLFAGARDAYDVLKGFDRRACAFWYNPMSKRIEGVEGAVDALVGDRVEPLDLVFGSGDVRALVRTSIRDYKYFQRYGVTLDTRPEPLSGLVDLITEIMEPPIAALAECLQHIEARVRDAKRIRRLQRRQIRRVMRHHKKLWHRHEPWDSPAWKREPHQMHAKAWVMLHSELAWNVWTLLEEVPSGLVLALAMRCVMGGEFIKRLDAPNKDSGYFNYFGNACSMPRTVGLLSEHFDMPVFFSRRFGRKCNAIPHFPPPMSGVASDVATLTQIAPRLAALAYAAMKATEHDLPHAMARGREAATAIGVPVPHNAPIVVGEPVMPVEGQPVASGGAVNGADDMDARLAMGAQLNSELAPWNFEWDKMIDYFAQNVMAIKSRKKKGYERVWYVLVKWRDWPKRFSSWEPVAQFEAGGKHEHHPSAPLVLAMKNEHEGSQIADGLVLANMQEVAGADATEQADYMNFFGVPELDETQFEPGELESIREAIDQSIDARPSPRDGIPHRLSVGDDLVIGLHENRCKVQNQGEVQCVMGVIKSDQTVDAEWYVLVKWKGWPKRFSTFEPVGQFEEGAEAADHPFAPAVRSMKDEYKQKQIPENRLLANIKHVNIANATRDEDEQSFFMNYTRDLRNCDISIPDYRKKPKTDASILIKLIKESWDGRRTDGSVEDAAAYARAYGFPSGEEENILHFFRQMSEQHDQQ